ncbi:transcriptional regulator [Burkholderia ubonensis]|uniref:transcriptional regulator n=1 Tax=Burkholderia ubonensis TaxID=101571 RepID=UPI0007C7BDC6|nr:YdaS family helix-turn-helix protein [Burkholderia ubonensis]
MSEVDLGLHPLERASLVVGSRSELARICKVKPAHIWNWMHRDRRGVPAEACVRIEVATGGVVSRRDLRPDDWQDIWPELGEPTKGCSKERK